MISGNKKNNVSRLKYTHLLSNVLHSFYFVFHDIKMHFYITPFI